MFKGAIIGLGNVALNGHVPGWKGNSEFQIVAGMDPHADRRELFSQALPEAFCTDCFAQLPEELDFIDICTPPHTHFKMIMEALGRGWTFFVRNRWCSRLGSLTRFAILPLKSSD